MPKFPLGDVLRVKHGFAFPGSQFSDDPALPTVVTPGNFAIGGGFRETKPKTLDGCFPPEFVLGAGDVVVTMTDLSKSGDTLGLPAKIPSTGTYLHNQRIGLIQVLDAKRIDPDFLHYYLRTDGYRAHILGTASGSTVRHTSPSRIESFVATVTTLGEQRAIADALGALDEKIATNERVAAGSLEVADALYLRQENRTGGRSTIGAQAVTVLGGTPSRKVPEYWTSGTVPWIASGKANEARVLEPSEWITEEALAKSAAKMMPKGATVVAITGATLGQISRLEIATSGNQSLVGIWHGDSAANDWLYFALRNEIDELLKHSTGAAQQHVNKAAVDGLEIPRPSDVELKIWGEQVRPLLDAAAAADKESRVLATTRDELLPLLMSGKVRVKDAEKTVEGVL